MKLCVLNTLEIMQDYDSYVIPFFSSKKMADFFESEFCSLINPYLESELFKAKKNEVYSFTSFFKETSKHVHIVLVGFGEEDSVSSETLMSGFGKAITELQKLKAKNPIIFVENLSPCIDKIDYLLKSFKAMILADYTFENYQTKEDKTQRIEYIDIFTQNLEASRCAKRATMFAENTIIARDLVNEPANMLKPADLAERVSSILKDTDVDLKIYNQSDIEKFGMHAFLSVAKGSAAEPKLLVMNYKGSKKSEEKLALVGKGLTYDSGGYSIKPTDSMITMKSDMAGAASVIAAIKSIAEAKLKVNVVAIVAACENMISGESYLPGDLIPSMSGKFIEIVNTDAEGRLTLADAVNFAIKNEEATKVVDVATLTGAVIVALGLDYSGVISNNEELFNIVEKASKISNEKIWRLPFDEGIKEKNKSEIADLKNSGGKYAGSSTAGAFIGEFVGETPWVHIDIAGTSFAEKDQSYCRKGATGYGVELLFNVAAQIK